MYYSLPIYEDETTCANFAASMYARGDTTRAVEVLSDRVRRVPNSPKCATLLSSILRHPELYSTSVDKHTPRTGIRYALIVLSTFDHPELRATLTSIRNSDWSGEIIISEDGDVPDRRCEVAAQEFGCTYLKNIGWIKPGRTLMAAVKQANCDVAVATHSDVIFPSKWFSVMDNAWSRVYESGKVGILNTQYCGYISGEVGEQIRNIFNSALQEQLEYVFTALRPELPLIRYVTNRLPYHTFGMGRCEHNDKRERYMAMPSMMSPCYSIDKRFLDKIGYDVLVSSEINVRYLTQLIVNRMWEFTVTTPFWIHQATTDINRVIANSGEFRHTDFEDYIAAHGFDATHVFCKAYAGIYIGYESRILEAVNTNKLGELDYLFDIMEEEILNGNCDDCDIQWCHVKGHQMGARTLSEENFRRADSSIEN